MGDLRYDRLRLHPNSSVKRNRRNHANPEDDVNDRKKDEEGQGVLHRVSNLQIHWYRKPDGDCMEGLGAETKKQ